jgi:hypothetical protein
MHTAQQVADLINAPDYQREAYQHWAAMLDRAKLAEVEQLVDRFGAVKTLERMAPLFDDGETLDAQQSLWRFAAFLKFLERTHSAPHN